MSLLETYAECRLARMPVQVDFPYNCKDKYEKLTNFELEGPVVNFTNIL